MPNAPHDDACTIVATKRDARRDAHERRAEAFSSWRLRGAGSAARLLAGHVNSLLQATGAAADPSAHIVSAYLPMRTELDAIPLLQALADAGLMTALPVVVARDTTLQFRGWTPGGATVPAGFGTGEPPPDNPTVEPDLLLVPLLAFDRHGWRLGYGGGYYDRTLRALRRSAAGRRATHAVGIAFDEQEIDAVPHLDYDERLDAILTPAGLRRFAR